jgi:hypothetical protein
VRPTGVRRAAVVVLAVFAALVVVPTSRAWACSCAEGSVAQNVARADVVLRGTVDDVRRQGPSLIGRSDETARYRVRVAKVYAGEAAARTTVRSGLYSASCGVEDLLPGREYVLFADARDGELWVGLCGGNDLAASGLVADVEDVTGAGHAPSTGERASSLPGATTTDRSWLLPLAGGSVLAVLLGAALVVVLLRGRRR